MGFRVYSFLTVGYSCILMRTGRQMTHRDNYRNGFTLAELLIVVAIIGVLVGIAIPIFAAQLENSREATDAANIRSQYAQVMAEAISTGESVNGKTLAGPVSLRQKKDGWSSETIKSSLESIFGEHIVGNGPHGNGTAWVEYNAEGGFPVLHYEGGGSSDVPQPSGPAFAGNTVNWDDLPTDSPYTVHKGQVFSWNGSYYVGTRDAVIDAWQMANSNPDIFTKWFTIAKFTGTIHDISEYPSDTNVMQQVERGDVCRVGDDYYVFSDGGNTTYGPVREPGRWTKINS